MKLGTLGILSKEIFDSTSPKFVDQAYIYLTIANDKTEEYKEKYPKIRRTIFEARWYLVEKNADIICMAMYLSESLTPDEVVSVGDDFKVSSVSDNKWKYYKVLLSFNNKVETIFLHEKCLGFFTWHHKEEIDFHEVDPVSLPLLQLLPNHLSGSRSNNST